MRLERGSVPHFVTMVAICKATNLTIDELAGLIEDEVTTTTRSA